MHTEMKAGIWKAIDTNSSLQNYSGPIKADNTMGPLC